MTKAKAKKMAPVEEVLRRLRKTYPEARCALDFRTPLELLVAVILSAQCTDVRVNLITPALFKRFRSARDLAEADLAELETLIKSAGFYHNKARSIQGAARLMVEKHGGAVPMYMAALTALPGIGRKTANVILGVTGHQPGGVVVDTHVTRLARRFGWTGQADAEKIERELNELVPAKEWVQASHLLIFHGRQICVARKPKCDVCPLNDICPAAFTF